MKTIILPALLSILGLVAACSSGGADASASSDAFTEKQDSGRSLPTKTIALTFDDGPGPRTSELSAYLKSEGIHASFFMEGINAQGKESVMKQVNDDGHIIGNHTWDHPLLTKLSAASIETEIRRTDAVVSPFFTGNMKMFRAPYGGWSPKIGDNLEKTDLKNYVGSIFWDIGGELTATHAADWACWGKANISVDNCAARYLTEIHDRGDHGIVLIHDIHSKSVDMVKVLVPLLKAQGFRFARVDQIPSINAELIANGGTPAAAITAPSTTTTTPAKPASLGILDTATQTVACGDDSVSCGAAVDGDPSTLYRCTNHVLNVVCPCTDTCMNGDFGGTCTCGDAEPGVPDACDPNSSTCKSP